MLNHGDNIPSVTKDQIAIYFDGGTSCNVPRRGYGKGYGSYRIGETWPIVRLAFDEAMSANAAEIRTLAEAITDAANEGFVNLLIIGDSQIALAWANHCAGNGKPRKMAKGSSPEFADSIRRLQVAASRLDELQTRWRGRVNSVEIFGH